MMRVLEVHDIVDFVHLTRLETVLCASRDKTTLREDNQHSGQK